MKYFDRITKSARGEPFNTLIYPFLVTTFVYGFVFLFSLESMIGASLLFTTMAAISPVLPVIWGAVALSTVVMGATFLLFNIPPAGTYAGLMGFMAWFFIAILYVMAGEWLTMLAIALPNSFFWIWQFISLSRFRREDVADEETLSQYDKGGYDDVLHPRQGRKDREDNRGRDSQSGGSYDHPDFGDDPSRDLDNEQ